MKIFSKKSFKNVLQIKKDFYLCTRQNNERSLAKKENDTFIDILN